MTDSHGGGGYEIGGDESSSKRDQDKLLPGSRGYEGGGDESSSKRYQDKLLPGSSSKRYQDKFLPIGNVSRIIKKGLPPDAKITKEAKELIQEAANEFVSLITSEASYICRNDIRKTLNGDDLLESMAIFEFKDYIEPLKVYLQKYREIEGYPKEFRKDGVSSQNEQLDVSNLMQSSQNEQL